MELSDLTASLLMTNMCNCSRKTRRRAITSSKATSFGRFRQTSATLVNSRQLTSPTRAKFAQELSKDPTVLRSANSISRLFKGGSKNNVTTIFAKNLIESATEDLQIEIESCSSMSSGSCESGMDMMDSVLNITGLIHAEKNRIKGERSREDVGLLSQIAKFKPEFRATTETHQRESTHELTHRRDSQGHDTMAYLHKGYSLTRLSDLRQGKIRTVTGKTLRIKCSKENEILRQKMIYNARQELAPPKKKKFKTVAKAVAWTVRNRLAFMKGDQKNKEQEEEEKLQKLAKITVRNVIKNAVKKVELEERKEAIREERRRRANRRKITKTPNYFGELEDFPDPTPWVQKYDKNHNKDNKALTYLVREIQRDIKENELGPPRPGLELPCSNLSLRHSKHSDLNLARHGDDTEEEPTILSERKNSTIHFGDITKIEDSDTSEVREEDKLSIAAGGAPAEPQTLKSALKPSKTDIPRTGKESTSKPDYLGGKSGSSSVTREAKGAGMIGLFPATDIPSSKKSPKSGGILKDDKKKGVKGSVQNGQGTEMSPALTDETRTQARQSSSQDAEGALSSAAADEPVPIWTKAPKEKKSWTSQDKPRDMTDPRVDAPYMLRSLTEVRSGKSAEEMEEPPPAPRSSECLIKGVEGLSSSSGSSGGTPDAEPVEKMPAQRQAGLPKEGARVRATAVADSGAVVPYSADDGVRTAVQKITVAVTEGMMATNPHLRIVNRAVSIVDPVMQATEAMLFHPTLLGDLIHQVNHTYNTVEATTLGLTRYFTAIMSGVLTRVAGLMPLIGATEEDGLPTLPSNAPVDRTNTATSTGKRLMAIKASPPPSESGVTDQKGTAEQSRRKNKLSKGRYPVRGESPGIKESVPTASMPRKSSIPCMERDQVNPHTAAQSRKTGKPDSTEGAKKQKKTEKSESQEAEGIIWKVPDRRRRSSLHPEVVKDLKSTIQHREKGRQKKTTDKSDSQEAEGTIWKVPDRRRRSSLNPEVVKDVKNTLRHREEERQEKKPTLHFTSQSSAVSQKSTVTKYGKGKKKDTTSQETSQALTKTTLAFAPPPPPPPLPGCLPGGSKPAKAAPVVYTTQTAEVGQRAAVSSREEDGTEISTETATMATMMEAQFSAPPAPPPLPPPDYYLSGGDESDDETLKEQAPQQESAIVILPPKYLDRFQSQGLRHVEFHPSPRSSAASSVAGSAPSSRASSPANTPRSASPVNRDHAGQGVQSAALAAALHDVRDNRHGTMQPRRDSLAFQIHSQATKLKHSTIVRRKTSTGETEDTAETSHMVATVQAGRIPSPPPLPSFSLGLSAHPALAMSPLSPMTLGQALHDAIGRREQAAPGHMPSSSPGNDSLSFRLQSQAMKLKHSTTVRRKTSTGETEDTNEASQMVATVEASRVPTPPPLPPLGLGAHSQIAPPASLAIASPAPTMGLLSASPLPQFGGLGGLTSHGLTGGTAMRHTSTSAKVTQKTSVKKGDETVENVAEASQTMATMEAGHIPAPPPLPTREQLRRASLAQAVLHPRVHGVGFGRVPSPPALPHMELLMSGISRESELVPSPPALPPMELLMSGISHGPGLAPPPPALPPLELLMSGISHGFGGITQPPPTSMLSPNQGQGGGTFMRSTTASNKMTHKTKVTKGDETVENVAEAGQTLATMEAGHIPAPPPLPTREQLRRASLAQAVVHPRVHGVGFGRVPSPPALPPVELLMSGISRESGLVPSPPALPPMELLMSGISHGPGLAPPPPALPPMELLMSGISYGFGGVTQPTPTSMLSPGQGQGGGTFMRSTTASNKMTHKTKVTKGEETVENVAEASETLATMEAGHVPAPPPLPTPEQLRRFSLAQAVTQPNMALQMAGPSATAIPQSPPSLMTPGQGQGGGTFMRSTTASNKMTHKTKVTKGDETVENVAEAGQTVATMEAGHIPAPPPLPTPEQLRRFSLAQAVPQPNMALQMAGPSALAIPQSPPSLMTPAQGQGGGTFMRSTTASNKMTHKTKVTKGDETVENVAEASETLATMEAGHIPAPPPLPTREQLRRASLAQAVVHPRVHGVGFGRVPSPPALPPMELLMSGISHESGRVPPPPALPPMELLMSGISHGPGLAPPPPALPPMELLMSGISYGFGGVTSQPTSTSMLSPSQGQGGTFMRSTMASNKMTRKTKVTKGDETVENVAEAGQTVATMEAGHIPAPPPLPTPEQLRRFSLAQAIPQPNMALQMAGPSAIAIPQSPASLMTPGQGQGGGTFMRSTTASNKMTHKTKVTKGEETVENVAEASETLATMEAGHIPAPPPLPTREQLRRASLAQAVVHPRVHGVGFGRVPSPPALPPMELLMSGISHESGLVPPPPALPPMELLMSGISHGPGLAPPPPALSPMELLMSGISHGFGGVTSQPTPTSMLSLGQGQGGTFMRSTTASNKMTHKAKVTKGDETVENVAEASETLATMEAGHIPAPPPLPTREQLRRASLAQAVVPPRVHGVGFGRVPSPPALPPMELLMSGISHESGLVPPPPALPPMELLMSGISHGPGLAPPPPALPPMELLMSGISYGFGGVTQPTPTSMLSPGQGQGGGTFMRSTTASNKMTHKTKVTKGDETVENVAEASETLATMEAGHIPAPPPLLTREQLRRASLAQAVVPPRVHGVGFGRVPSPPALPPMELLMSGISHESGRVPSPPPLPPMELLISEISYESRRVPNPPALPPMELLMSGIPGFPGQEVSQALPGPLLDLVGAGARQPALDPNRQYTVMTMYSTQGSNLPQKKARHDEGDGHGTTEVGVGAKTTKFRTNIPDPPPLPEMKFFVRKPYVQHKGTFGHEIAQKVDRFTQRREMSLELHIARRDSTDLLLAIEENASKFSPEEVEEMRKEANEDIAKIDACLNELLMLTSMRNLVEDSGSVVEDSGSVCSEELLPVEIVSTDDSQTDPLAIQSDSQLTVHLHRQSDDSQSTEQNQLKLCQHADHGESAWHQRGNHYQVVHGEKTPCCLADHAQNWSYKPPRFKCGSCDETLLMKFHLETDSEGGDDEEEGHTEVPVPICRTKKHQHDHNWTYNPPQMTCKSCHVKAVLKTHLKSDEEDGDPAERPVPIYHRSPRKDPGTHPRLIQSRSDNKASQIPLVRKPSKTSERKYPYRQPGEKAYSTAQASSRKLPKPKVIVTPEMRRQPAAKAVSVSGAAEASARQGRTPPENVETRTTDGTSPPNSTAAKADKQSVKGSAEPAAQTQKGTVKGGKREKTQKEYSQKVWEALVGDDNEWESPKTKATPPKDAKKPSTATKDAGTKSTQKGAKAPKVEQTGDQTAKLTPTKIPQPIKDAAVKRKDPIMGTTALSAKRTEVRSTDKASVTQAAHPPTKIPQPIKETDAHQRKVPVMGTTALSAKRAEMQSTDKESVTQAAHPPTKIPQPIKEKDAQRKVPVMGTTALSAKRTDMQTEDKQAAHPPTKIPQPIKETGVERKVPVMGTTALSAKRADVQSTDKTSVTQAAHPPTKIPQPIKETDAHQRKVPVMGTTALSAKRTEVRSTDKTSVTQAAHPPTKIPQPIKETDAHQRKVPVMGTTALSAKRADVQSTDKTSVTQAAHPPTKIPQPIKETDAHQRKVPVMGTTALSAKRTEVRSTDKASVKQAAHPPTKIPQPIKETGVERKVPVMGTTALYAKRAEMQSADKTSVTQAAHQPTKIPQPIKEKDVKRKTPMMGTTALSAKRADMQTEDKQAAHPPTKIPQPIQVTAVRRKTPVMGTTALSARRGDMQTAGKQTAHPTTKIPQPIPIQVTAVKRETPVVGTTALSARRTEEPKGVQTRPASMKTTQPAKDSADRPNTPLKESATAGPSSAQTGPASMKSTQPANDSADTPRTPQKESAAARPSSAQTTPTAGQFRAQTEYKPPERKRPDAWVSSGIKKYTDEERAKLDAEVDEYWGRRFSKDREKPWWNIEDPEERERARLRQDRSKTDLRRTGSGVAAASYKRPGIQEQVKYGGGVDRSPVMLPGHYGAATGVSRASRPGTGLVPKKLEMDFFDSSEDSEDEIDLDKPISKEDLHDDEYWMAMEKKAYSMVKASMEQLETGQLETVDEESPVDEKKVQGASPTVKKPSKFARMFQSRKEREQKIDREAREMAMKQQAAKKLDTVEHKSDPPNGKPVYGPPLPPEMQREKEKKKGLTRYGHKPVPTLATMKSKEEEPSTSQKSGGRLTPTKLVGKIKGGFTRVKDSIRSRLSGEESDTTITFDTGVPARVITSGTARGFLTRTARAFGRRAIRRAVGLEPRAIRNTPCCILYRSPVRTRRWHVRWHVFEQVTAAPPKGGDRTGDNTMLTN
ncbi:hypothetical protein Bbelb_115210 [Branchiostoma belcheri]|nr:hypothetical protein Bbelb_115210 [Branchiostoma belcheri]